MSSKLYSSTLKSYHIFLLGCLLGVIFIINSNIVNNKKQKIQQDKKEQALFNRLIYQRRLLDNSGADEEAYESDIVCSYASEELQEYYRTNDLSKIDLDDGPIKCEDKDKDYMKTLIEIAKSLIGDDDTDEEGEEGGEGGSGEGGVSGGGASEGEGVETGGEGGESGGVEGGRRRSLRNLIDSETKKNIKKYINRVMPMLVFAGFGVLSAVGWIFCICCSCYNCCCCCCCKKPSCKLPFFIITYFFYAAVISISIYGLTQTKKIFTGLSNAECSFLKFFETILFGETKNEKPKWIGVENIANIFTDLNTQIAEMKNSNLEDDLEYNMQDITAKRDAFFDSFKTIHKRFYSLGVDGEIGDPKVWYYLQYNSEPIQIGSETLTLDGKYVLDLIPLFGTYNEENEEYTGLNNIWNIEIEEVDRKALKAVEDAEDSFTRILGDNLDKIESGLTKGNDYLGKLKDPLNDFYNSISGTIYDVSDKTNEIGEKVVNCVFGFLVGANVFLTVALLFICQFSKQRTDRCCFFLCIFKVSTTIIWNLLALFTIIAFLVGAVLALVGRVGGDIMSLISYVMSEENFKDQNPVIINKLGDGKDVLEECLVKNGNLSKVFDLSDITKDFDTIYSVKNQITGYKQNFTNLVTRFPAYNQLKDYLNKRTEFIDDTTFKNIADNLATNIATAFSLSQMIKLLNDSIGTNNNEKWNPYTGDKTFICDSTINSAESTNPILHPWTCQPIYRGWVDSDNGNIKKYGQIVSHAIDVLKYANGDKTHTNTDYESYFDVLESLKVKYEEYLNTFVTVLEFFEGITGDIINILEDGIGNSNETLSGKFMKTNLKIVLKYLKYSLGEDFFTVGICLVAIGFSLIFSISCTILLIVIINLDIEHLKNFPKETEIPKDPEVNVNNDANDIKVFEYKSSYSINPINK